MLMFTHPGENRDSLRSQYEFHCFYVCISFPPEEKSAVVTKLAVGVSVHFFACMFHKTYCDFLHVTKHCTVPPPNYRILIMTFVCLCVSMFSAVKLFIFSVYLLFFSLKFCFICCTVTMSLQAKVASGYYSAVL